MQNAKQLNLERKSQAAASRAVAVHAGLQRICMFWKPVVLVLDLSIHCMCIVGRI